MDREVLTFVIAWIPIEEIDLTRQFDPRMGKRDIEGLKESIARFGLNYPITVTKYNGKYVIVDGHRRMAALVELGLTKIPCYIKPYDEYTAQWLAIELNIQNESISEGSYGWRIQSMIKLLMESDGLNSKTDYSEYRNEYLKKVADKQKADIGKLDRFLTQFEHGFSGDVGLIKELQQQNDKDTVEQSKIKDVTRLAKKTELSAKKILKEAAKTGIQQRGIERVMREHADELRNNPNKLESLFNTMKTAYTTVTLFLHRETVNSIDTYRKTHEFKTRAEAVEDIVSKIN